MDLVKPMERELVITRTFAASRRLVFKAWTDPKRMAQWWGPHGFSNPVCQLDARPGGAILIVMRAPDGVEYPMTGVFRELVEPERIVFTTAVDDANGNRVLEGHNVVTFVEQSGKTTITLTARAVGFVDYAVRMLDGMNEGWTQSIDRFEAYLAAL